MTQSLKGLFTKGKCVFTKGRVYFIQKFEFLSWLSSFHIDEWEKSRPFLWLRLLGMKIFRIHQTSTFLNPWVSLPVLHSFDFIGSVPFCFCFLIEIWRIFFPKMYSEILNLAASPRLLFVIKFRFRRERTGDKFVKAKQENKNKTLSFFLDLHFGAMWGIGFYQLHLS